MAPVRSIRWQVDPLGISTVSVDLPLRNQSGQIVLIDVEGEGQCPGLALSAGIGFGQGITVPGVRATADLQLASGADGWRFGFIQFLRFRVLDVVYRGATSSEGSVFAQIYPENEQTRLALDQTQRGDRSQPWYDPNCVVEAAAAGDGHLTIPFQDTPSDFFEVRRTNQAAGRSPVSNWLHSCWFRLQFTTVLAAQSPGGRVEPMESFDWTVDWNLTFTRGDGPNPDDNWTRTPNPCLGKTVDRPSHAGLRRHPAIAARFSSPTFQMLPIVRVEEMRTLDPRLVYSASW
jgi:hypothetical protein